MKSLIVILCFCLNLCQVAFSQAKRVYTTKDTLVYQPFLNNCILHVAAELNGVFKNPNPTILHTNQADTRVARKYFNAWFGKKKPNNCIIWGQDSMPNKLAELPVNSLQYYAKPEYSKKAPGPFEMKREPYSTAYLENIVGIPTILSDRSDMAIEGKYLAMMDYNLSTAIVIDTVTKKIVFNLNPTNFSNEAFSKVAINKFKGKGYVAFNDSSMGYLANHNQIWGSFFIGNQYHVIFDVIAKQDSNTANFVIMLRWNPSGKVDTMVIDHNEVPKVKECYPEFSSTYKVGNRYYFVSSVDRNRSCAVVYGDEHDNVITLSDYQFIQTENQNPESAFVMNMKGLIWDDKKETGQVYRILPNGKIKTIATIPDSLLIKKSMFKCALIDEDNLLYYGYEYGKDKPFRINYYNINSKQLKQEQKTRPKAFTFPEYTHKSLVYVSKAGSLIKL